jgi:hypothetical protein
MSDQSQESSGSKVTSAREPMQYHDFNLRLGFFETAASGESSYKVWVEGATPGGGSMRPENAFQVSFDPKKFWNDPMRGRGGLVGDLDKRQGWTPERAYELGGLLADHALPEGGGVRRLFEQSLAAVRREGQGLRLRLRIDALSLANIPWEFTCLPQASGEAKPTDFLALRREVSIARTDTVESAPPGLPERGHVRLAAVLSSPADQQDLDVSKDEEAIQKAVNALRQATGKDLVEVIWGKRPATVAALQAAVGEGVDLFHFGGHAEFNPIDQKGSLLLEKEDETADYYDAERLAVLLGNARVRLAVLGACESGRRDATNVWSGIAPALTREHIPAVIANQFRIRDASAILMAAKVYHRVLAGFTIDEALFEARQAIFQASEPGNRDWGTPVLYLRESSGVLFPLPKPGEAQAAASPFIDVADTFKSVAGEVIDVQIEEVSGGTIKIRNVIEEVKPGGSFIGLKIGKLGGSGD